MSRSFRASLIVSTEVRPESIFEQMHALSRQSLPAQDYQIIYADGTNEFDWSPYRSLIDEYKSRAINIEIAILPASGRAACLNYGIKNSSAPIVIFLGGDFVPRQDFIEKHLEFHDAHPEEHYVGIGLGLFNKQSESHFANWAQTSGALFGYGYGENTESVPSDYFCNANVSGKRSFFLRAGLLNEVFPWDMWDDYEFGLRLSKLGMKSVFVKGASAEHDHPVTLKERTESLYRAGRSAAMFDALYGNDQPWQEILAISPWRLKLSAYLNRFLNLITGEQTYLHEYYKNTLWTTFARGYRQEKQGKDKAETPVSEAVTQATT